MMETFTLSHTESEEILRLGYDFSPICRDFGYFYETNLEYLKFTKIKGEVYSDGEKIYRSFWNTNSYGYIPLIPIIAIILSLPMLDHCKSCTDIPDADMYKLAFRFDVDLKHAWIEELYSCNPVKSFSSEHFKENSIFYEIFKWCHENYPEQLQTRFNEVIK